MIRNSKGQFIEGHTTSKEIKEKISKSLSGENHPNYGKHNNNHLPNCTCFCCKSKRGEMSGEKANNWKGNDIKYLAKHIRIIKIKGKASKYFCIDCGKQARDWSNIDHLYSNKLDDYIPRCRKCHCEYDKKFNNVKRGGKR